MLGLVGTVDKPVSVKIVLGRCYLMISPQTFITAYRMAGIFVVKVRFRLSFLSVGGLCLVVKYNGPLPGNREEGRCG
jgi:hypothetical protein